MASSKRKRIVRLSIDDTAMVRAMEIRPDGTAMMIVPDDRGGRAVGGTPCIPAGSRSAGRSVNPGIPIPASKHRALGQYAAAERVASPACLWMNEQIDGGGRRR